MLEIFKSGDEVLHQKRIPFMGYTKLGSTIDINGSLYTAIKIYADGKNIIVEVEGKK